MTKSVGCSFFKVIDRFGILNFGHWNLFDIWYLCFVIYICDIFILIIYCNSD